METATATPTTTETTTESSQPWTVDDHLAALREAGSYTLKFRLESQRSGALVATEQVDLDTGARYSAQTSVTSAGNFTTEFYLPPNSDTAYTYEPNFNRTGEAPASRAKVSHLSKLGTNRGSWPEFREVGSGETELGSATVYVVDSVDAVNESVRDQYDSIESFEWRIWVDDDTGVIAKYQWRVEYVKDGSNGFTQITIELTDLGSTTVEAPEWVPSDASG